LKKSTGAENPVLLLLPPAALVMTGVSMPVGARLKLASRPARALDPSESPERAIDEFALVLATDFELRIGLNASRFHFGKPQTCIGPSNDLDQIRDGDAER
jgi:hypothetical protein